MTEWIEVLDEPSMLEDEESKVSLGVIEVRGADEELIVTLLVLLKLSPPVTELLFVELTDELVDSLRDCPVVVPGKTELLELSTTLAVVEDSMETLSDDE